MKRGIYIAFDQLNKNFGALAQANPKNDVIILVESQRMLQSRNWHIQRLWFMISAAKHFAAELEADGFKVIYKKSATTRDGILAAKSELKLEKIIGCEPNSYRLIESTKDIVEYQPSDFFLTSRAEFIDWAKNQKSLLMENLYRIQRKRFNILMDGEKPVGGAWNFDKENRLTPPKGYEFPPYLEHKMDRIDLEVLAELKGSDLKLWGDDPHQTWGTSRKSAVLQLNYFLENGGSQIESTSRLPLD